MRLPTFYISHGGGPCFWMDVQPPGTFDRLGEFLSELAESVGERPKAVLVISAHWEERDFTVQTKAHPELFFDYYGFPEETYQLAYPAPGSPELAGRVRELLDQAGVRTTEDVERDYDHGVFVPFKLIYPAADVPIVQLSLRHDLDPEAHLAVGRALEPLRDEGILIVGSGMSFHNLSRFGRDRGESLLFDEWLNHAVTAPTAEERDRALRSWSAAPAARDAHPREEHLLPLMVAAGAGGADRGQAVLRDQIWGASYSAFRFG